MRFVVPAGAAAVTFGGLWAASMSAAAPGIGWQLFHGAGAPAAFAALAALACALEAAVAPVDAAGDDAGHGPTAGPAGAGPVSARVTALARATGLLLLAVWITAAVAIGACGPPVAAAAAGTVMMAAGAVLRGAAIRRLGQRFNSTNAIAAGAALERDGVYRWLAHPSELGLMLLAGGAAVMALSPAPALLVAVLWGITAARLRLEEAALVRHHGDGYRAYRRTTFDPLPRWV